MIMENCQVSIKVSPETLLVEVQGWSLVTSDILGDELECLRVILHYLFDTIDLQAEVLKLEDLQHV